MDGREHGAEQNGKQHRREHQLPPGEGVNSYPVTVTAPNSAIATRGKIHDDFGIGPCALMPSISCISLQADSASNRCLLRR